VRTFVREAFARLTENCLRQFNLLKKPLLGVVGVIGGRTPQPFEGFAALLRTMLGQLRHFLRIFLSVCALWE
jgi:hypothetical protein